MSANPSPLSKFCTAAERLSLSMPRAFLLLLNIIGAFGQIVMGQLSSFVPSQNSSNLSTGSTSPDETKFQPMAIGIVLIWLLMVFPGMLIFCAYSIFRPSLFSSIGLYTMLALFGNSLWECLAFFFEPPGRLSWIAYEIVLFIVLAVTIAAPLLTAMLVLRKHAYAMTCSESLCVFVPSSLFAGWATCATFVNLSSVVLFSDAHEFGVLNKSPEYSGTIAYALIVATCLCTIIWTLNGNSPFTFVCVWAYFWIGLKALMDSANQAIGLVVVAFVCCILFAVLEVWIQRRHRLNSNSGSQKLGAADDAGKSAV